MVSKNHPFPFSYGYLVSKPVEVDMGFGNDPLVVVWPLAVGPTYIYKTVLNTLAHVAQECIVPNTTSSVTHQTFLMLWKENCTRVGWGMTFGFDVSKPFLSLLNKGICKRLPSFGLESSRGRSYPLQLLATRVNFFDMASSLFHWDLRASDTRIWFVCVSVSVARWRRIKM